MTTDRPEEIPYGFEDGEGYHLPDSPEDDVPPFTDHPFGIHDHREDRR